MCPCCGLRDTDTLPAQDLVNMPFLDRYFLWSSVLGTHTFFMLFLPAVYLLLGPDFGRRFVVALTVSLIMLSTLAVYVTAVLKVCFCALP